MNHSSGQAFAGEPKGVDDLISPLLRSQAADMDEREPAAHPERRTHGLAAAARVKQLRIHPSAPDLDVVHLEPDEIPARDGRRRKDSPASTMEPAQVRRYCSTEPRHPVRHGVTGKVGVVGRHQRQPGPRGGDLSHAADSKLGSTVNQIGLESLDETWMEPGRGNASLTSR